MALENSEISSCAATSKLQICLFRNHFQKLIGPSRSASSYRFAPKISPAYTIARTRMCRVTNRVPMTHIWDPSLFWLTPLTRMTSALGHYCLLLTSADPKKKNFKFRILNFKIRKFKKKMWDNCLILFSWAKLEPSHRATELRSQAKTISRSEPLSRDSSHRAMIQPSQAEIEVPKPKFKPPSL